MHISSSYVPMILASHLHTHTHTTYPHSLKQADTNICLCLCQKKGAASISVSLFMIKKMSSMCAWPEMSSTVSDKCTDRENKLTVNGNPRMCHL